MRILVTNDDGVDSPGIHALAAALVDDGHDVFVVAPTDDRSGAGASIGRMMGVGPPPVEQRVWDELPDLSVHDPYYITPLLMGLSMYVMSYIGMKAAPPNPQAKMMSFMMPVMLTVLFLNLASGLNLYYAVQNLAALPQQWLLARERQKSAPVAVVSTPVASPAIKRRS